MLFRVRWCLVAPIPLCMILTGLLSGDGQAIPAYSRKFGLSCGTCHTHPPSLSEFGMAMVRSGPASKGMFAGEWMPVTYRFGVLGERVHTGDGDTLRVIPSRGEIVLFGSLTGKLSYFVEWKPVNQTLLYDGAILDTNGRFGDAVLRCHASPDFQFSLGQDRIATQIDLSASLSFSAPAFLDMGVSGPGEAGVRSTALRSFSPGGRSPMARVLYAAPAGWHFGATIPFPGELSIPTTARARDTVSPSLEGSPKGIYLEAYRREGASSYGVGLFEGREGRRVATAMGAVYSGRWFFQSGIAEFIEPTRSITAASIEGAFIPNWKTALGIRVDSVDGRNPSFAPYASYHIDHHGGTTRVQIEARSSGDRRTQFGFAILFAW